MSRAAVARPALSVLAAALLVGGTSEGAPAQLLSVGVGAGPSFPAEAFNEESDTGFNLMGSLWVRPPVFPVGLRGDVIWQSFPDDLGGDFRQLAGFANATAELPSLLIRPYGLIGVGVVSHDAPDQEHPGHVHVGEDDTDVAFQVGAGVRLGLLGLNVFGEARYMHLGEENAAVPITVGILF